jgi:ferric-dicitrate binding protein FerR (iron transport regulator)
MDCGQALDLLSAHLDQEVHPGDRESLEAHLSTCASCRTAEEALRALDAELRQIFVPRRQSASAVATRVIPQLTALPVPNQKHWSWLPMLLAVAAGFLIAVLVFQPWKRAREKEAYEQEHRALLAKMNELEDERRALISSEADLKQATGRLAELRQQFHDEVTDFEASKPTAHLVIANGLGRVQVQPPGADSWSSLDLGVPVPTGARVRTDDTARCEFRTLDGSEVRLNNNTEVRFWADRQLELSQGQIYSNITRNQPGYLVKVPNADATVMAKMAQFDVACKAQETVVTVTRGTTNVMAGDPSVCQVVEAGQQAKIVKGVVEEPQKASDLLVATGWVHEVLRLKGRDNEELNRRLNDILAQLGRSKVDHLYEQQILSLGDHAVLPLVRYIQSDLSGKDPRKRTYAAELLPRIANPASTPYFIELLSDPDPEIRVIAASTLKRLTGVDQGIPATNWRELNSPASRVAPVERWNSWWGVQKDRYPSAP